MSFKDSSTYSGINTHFKNRTSNTDVDLLTLSKLESNRLKIWPECSQPISMVEKTIQMYEADLKDSRIECSLVVDPSYKDLDIGNIFLDQARLMQASCRA